MNHALVMNTLLSSVSIEGICLHSGRISKVTVSPYHIPEVVFRKDGRLYNLRTARVSGGYATTVAWHDYSVSMTEHLMAAAWCCNLSGFLVEVEGAEIPIIDGSSAPWVSAFHKAGFTKLKRKPEAMILEIPVSVKGKNGSYATAVPASEFKIAISTDYTNSGIGSCTIVSPPGNVREWALRELASSRTFVERASVDILRRNGLALGGSLSNAVVYDDCGQVLNPEGLRMKDEPHKHKTLDVLGDLFTLASDIKASITICRPGHEITAGLVSAVSKTQHRLLQAA